LSIYPDKITITAMHHRPKLIWEKRRKKQMTKKRVFGYLFAVVFCLSVGVYGLTSHAEKGVLSVMSTGFEYDETLGRLQYVSNILPESAMVFLTSDISDPEFHSPAETALSHVWSQAEPWIEYCSGSVIRACEDGEVLTVIEHRNNAYTVRVQHQGGYESIYSGLTDMDISEGSKIDAGEIIGYADNTSAFELRKDGVSILPVFSTRGRKP